MSKRHYVRQHHWVGGILKTLEHYFDTLEQAMAHAKKSDAHTVKIYAPTGDLLHVQTPTSTDTYA